MLLKQVIRSNCCAKAAMDGAADGAQMIMESFGARLRARREALQLDIKAVCDKLHVRCAVIEALEADDYVRAGTPLVYLRGYARNYVRLLNPDGSSLEQWLQEATQIGEGETPSTKRRSVRGVGRGGPQTIRPWFNPRWLPWVVVIGLVVLAVFLLQPASKPPASQEPDMTAETITPDAQEAGTEAVAASAVVDNSENMQPPAEAVSPRGKLRLEFTDRSWTQVEDGLGRILEKRTVEAGSITRYEGVLPFQVTLGNAVYVRVYFDDQEYDHLNDITDKNIARFRLGQGKE